MHTAYVSKVYCPPNFVYFIKLRTTFAIQKILPATHSNGKQVSKQNLLIITPRQAENLNTLWCFTFPHTCYKLLVQQFWAEEPTLPLSIDTVIQLMYCHCYGLKTIQHVCKMAFKRQCLKVFLINLYMPTEDYTSLNITTVHVSVSD